MKQSQQPNVVVFFTDQQRWDSTGIAGNPEGLTPNFDFYSRQGAYFDTAISAQPVCTPSRATLQTGRFATEVGVWRNGIALDSEELTLAHLFNQAGYDTAYVGKWHLGGSGAKGPVAPDRRGGYRFWRAANGLEHTSEEYVTTLWDEHEQPHRYFGYRVDAVTDVALDYIRSRETASQPFMLFLSLLEPHHQNRRDDFPAPDVYRDSYHGSWLPPDLAALPGNAHQSISGYYGMIKRIDEAYGRLMETLKSMALLENTLVVFTSDHGCHFKTRNTEYKRSIHDSSTRVPLMLRGPGILRGRRVEEVVSLVDVAPTVLSVAGIEVPEAMSGRDLSPLISGEGDLGEEVFIQVSESEVARGIRTQRWKYGAVGVGADPLTDAHAAEYRDAYLYDLYADPYELTNLAGAASHAEVLSILRGRLHHWMDSIGEPARTIRPAEPVEPLAPQLRVEPWELPGA